MKPSRDANELADRLRKAADEPLRMPAKDPEAIATEPPAGGPVSLPKAAATRAKPKRAVHKEDNKETVGISLRPTQALLNRYTLEAAERTRQTGRVVSAQQIMLEVLEKGL